MVSAAAEKKLLQPAKHLAATLQRRHRLHRLVRQQVSRVATRQQVRCVLRAELDEPFPRWQERTTVSVSVAGEQIHQPVLQERGRKRALWTAGEDAGDVHMNRRADAAPLLHLLSGATPITLRVRDHWYDA